MTALWSGPFLLVSLATFLLNLAGHSPATSLKHTAVEMRENAAALIKRAERIERAASLLQIFIHSKE
jgi:hypothetical protein